MKLSLHYGTSSRLKVLYSRAIFQNFRCLGYREGIFPELSAWRWVGPLSVNKSVGFCLALHCLLYSTIYHRNVFPRLASQSHFVLCSGGGYQETTKMALPHWWSWPQDLFPMWRRVRRHIPIFETRFLVTWTFLISTIKSFNTMTF